MVTCPDTLALEVRKVPFTIVHKVARLSVPGVSNAPQAWGKHNVRAAEGRGTSITYPDLGLPVHP